MRDLICSLKCHEKINAHDLKSFAVLCCMIACLLLSSNDTLQAQTVKHFTVAIFPSKAANVTYVGG